jgi:hypothetical protein
VLSLLYKVKQTKEGNAMTYYSYGFDKNTFDKYATIQSDVEDMYLEDVEEEEDEDVFIALDENELAELEMEMM